MQMTFSKQKRGKAQSSNPRSSKNYVSFSITRSIEEQPHIGPISIPRANNHIISSGSSSLRPGGRHASQ